MWDRTTNLFAATGGEPWGWCHSGWGWAMGLHGLFWLLVVAAIVAAVVLLIRGVSGAGSPPEMSGRATAGRGDSAIAILEARFARGEIGREEYLERKRDLS